MPVTLGNYDLPLDVIIARSIELDKERNPDIENLKHCVLRDGPRAFKYVKYWTIVNRHTNNIHHHVLTIETIHRIKRSGWQLKEKNTITLDDENTDEIQKLFDFLATISHVKGDGEYTIIRQDDERVSRILDAIFHTDQQQELLDQILAWVDTEL
jgi:hypothetical protein